MLLKYVFSKSEVIGIVKLFIELDGSLLYTQLAITMVKQMIDKDCGRLTRDITATNLKGIPSFAPGGKLLLIPEYGCKLQCQISPARWYQRPAPTCNTRLQTSNTRTFCELWATA